MLPETSLFHKHAFLLSNSSIKSYIIKGFNKKVKWKHSTRVQKGIVVFLFCQCTQQKEVLIIQPTPGLQEQEGERENSLCFKWEEVSGSLVCKIAGN